MTTGEKRLLSQNDQGPVCCAEVLIIRCHETNSAMRRHTTVSSGVAEVFHPFSGQTVDALVGSLSNDPVVF